MPQTFTKLGVALGRWSSQNCWMSGSSSSTSSGLHGVTWSQAQPARASHEQTSRDAWSSAIINIYVYDCVRTWLCTYMTVYVHYTLYVTLRHGTKACNLEPHSQALPLPLCLVNSPNGRSSRFKTEVSLSAHLHTFFWLVVYCFFIDVCPAELLQRPWSCWRNKYSVPSVWRPTVTPRPWPASMLTARDVSSNS